MFNWFLSLLRTRSKESPLKQQTEENFDHLIDSDSKLLTEADLQVTIKPEYIPTFKGDGASEHNDSPTHEAVSNLQDYEYPSLDLLQTHATEDLVEEPEEIEANKNRVLRTLNAYGIVIQKINATSGPNITFYEIVPARLQH